MIVTNILILKNQVARVNSLKLYDARRHVYRNRTSFMLSKCLGENCMLSGNKHAFFQGKLRWQWNKNVNEAYLNCNVSCADQWRKNEQSMM